MSATTETTTVDELNPTETLAEVGALEYFDSIEVRAEPDSEDGRPVTFVVQRGDYIFSIRPASTTPGGQQLYKLYHVTSDMPGTSQVNSGERSLSYQANEAMQGVVDLTVAETWDDNADSLLDRLFNHLISKVA